MLELTKLKLFRITEKCQSSESCSFVRENCTVYQLPSGHFCCDRSMFVCGFHHSKKEKKKKTIIWTVNSIWDVDTVLNKLLCTVEPLAIATDFWLWARSSEQSKSNDKSWENASPDSNRSSCADSKKAASWLHQQCLIISSSNHCFCLAFCFYFPLSCIGSQGIPGCLWGISLFSPSCAASPWTDPALQAQVWQFCELSCFQQNLKLVSSIFNLVHTVPFSPMNLQD